MKRSKLAAAVAAGVLVAFVVVGCFPLPSGAPVTSSVGSQSAPPASPANSSGRPTTAAKLPSGVSLRQIDGGQQYYGRFPNALPDDGSFFPIGVWTESVLTPSDTATDAAAGINTYVDLTDNSNVSIINDAAMYAIPGFTSAVASGFALSDEVDMWAGPGEAAWTGKYPGDDAVCSPAGSPCGYTIQKQRLTGAPSHSMIYANYGKGVTFWESDSEARTFVGNFQDVVSADNYWFTDPNICGAGEGGSIVDNQRDLTHDECRLAANYGWTVDRLRNLQSPENRKPVWGFVEDGHPSGGDSDPTITGPELRAAVWSSIIHGARGIIYFNHNFGGGCLSQHVLRDECGAAIRPTVTSVNKQVTALAPVINSPFVDGAASVNGPVDSATKIYDGGLYIMAGAAKKGGGVGEFTFKCGGGTSVTVIDENRALPMVNGTFKDTFADANAVHIYRINGGDGCGIAARDRG